MSERKGCVAARRLPARPSVSAALLLCVTGVSCIEFSPFETDLADSEQAQTRKNLESIAMLPIPDDEFRFAVIADSHQYLDELTRIIEHINDRDDIAFVAHLGDMTDMGLREEYRVTLRALEGLRVPFVTVIGNHDAVSNGKTLYRNMFGSYDYVFDFGFARFVCFNSNTLEFPGAPDLEWLAGFATKADGAERVVALSHQPSRSPDYARVLSEGGSDLLVTAHRHTWDLRQDRGTLEAVVAPALSGHWAIVLVSRRGVEMQRCVRDSCMAWEPT